MNGEAGVWIPVFPLPAVLFPGADLPLHIFEPRYQAMVRRCTEEGIPFAVVLLRGGNLAQVGCEASTEKVLHRYPDGRLDLLARGRQRVGILGLREHGDGYLEAKAASLEDTTEPEDKEAKKDLLGLFAEYVKLAEESGVLDVDEGEMWRAEDRAGVTSGYTFALAAESGMSLEEKQRFLETVSERQREQVLLRHLAQRMPVLRNQSVNRERVRGNGKLGPSA